MFVIQTTSTVSRYDKLFCKKKAEKKITNNLDNVNTLFEFLLQANLDMQIVRGLTVGISQVSLPSKRFLSAMLPVFYSSAFQIFNLFLVKSIYVNSSLPFKSCHELYSCLYTCIVLSYHLLQLLMLLPWPCSICSIKDTSSRTFMEVSSILLWWLKEIGMLLSRHRMKMQFSMASKLALLVESVKKKYTWLGWNK